MPQEQGEEKRLELFTSIIKELSDRKALEDMVLIGGWTLMLYRQHYQDNRIPMKSTTDVDFLFRNPPKVKNPFPIGDYLLSKGFTAEYSRTTGECRYKNSTLDIDFLIPHTGSADQAGVVAIPGYGIKASRLRYLDLSTAFTIQVDYNGAKITVPHPVAYTYGKFLVGPQRKNPVKKDKDLDTARKMSEYLQGNKDHMMKLHTMLEILPESWNAKFFESVRLHYASFYKVLTDFRKEQFVSSHMSAHSISSDKKPLLEAAEEILLSRNCEKHRTAVYQKVLEGLPLNTIPFYVNAFINKGKGDSPVSEILKTKNRGLER